MPARTVRDVATRPLTARSVLASTLLGTDPPRLPVAFLVRTGQLFGLAEGTVRTALSRMVAAGEALPEGDGWYALSGALVDRQHRQQRSRSASTIEWNGRWRIGVVLPGARTASDRTELRRRMQGHRLAELRDGVWTRPDNLADRSVAGGDDERCAWFGGAPDGSDGTDDAALVAGLWDLEGWAARATELRRSMHQLLGRLESGDTAALAPGFVLSADVLRHFLADPLLPRELLDRRWPGPGLRRDYDHYDAAYRRLLAAWTHEPLAAQGATTVTS